MNNYDLYYLLSIYIAAFANSFVGTVTYMSPERIIGEIYGYPCDIWSFGVTMFTVAEGKFPFSNTDTTYWGMIKAVCDEPVPIPPSPKYTSEFIDFIGKTLIKDPKAKLTAIDLLKHSFIKPRMKPSYYNSTTPHHQNESTLSRVTNSAMKYKLNKGTGSFTTNSILNDEDGVTIETPELEGASDIIDPIKLDHLECILESLHDMLRVTITIERELSGDSNGQPSSYYSGENTNNANNANNNNNAHPSKSQKDYLLGRGSSKESRDSMTGSAIINPLKSMDSIRPVRITTTGGASYDLNENMPSLVRLASGRNSPVNERALTMHTNHSVHHSGGSDSIRNGNNSNNVDKDKERDRDRDKDEKSVNSTTATVVHGGGGVSRSGASPPGKNISSMRKLIKIAGFNSTSDLLQWRHLANQLYLPYEVVLLHAKKRLSSILNEFRGDVIDPEIIKSMC